MTLTWKTQPWYGKRLLMSINSSASVKKLVNKFTEDKSPSTRNQVTKTSVAEDFSESLQMEGTLRNAAKLIPHSRRKSSTNNYNVAWSQWPTWCNNRQVKTFQATVNY